MPSVLVVLAPGAEEIETVTVADVLVRAGCDVTIAAAADNPAIGSRGIPLGGHVALDSVTGRSFDLVYLPGGIGSAEYCRDDQRVQQLAEDQLADGRLLAVICACPIALVPRQLCANRRLTSYPGVRDQVEPHAAVWSEAPVVVDGNLITSQGPGTAMLLALRLAELLTDHDTAVSVADAMLVSYP